VSAPEKRVLSQSLEAAVGDGRVRVAVFVAFQFDASFFEHAILPLLFRRGFSEDEGVRRAQLDEALRDLDHLAVYYDRSGLLTETGPARLDYRRIGVSTPGGVLHAKHVFLLVEDPGDPPQARFVMLTTSANLTQSGWWSNVEVGHVYEIRADMKDMVREDLLGQDGVFARLERLDRTTPPREGREGRDAPHAAIDALRSFLKRDTVARKHSSSGGRLHTRLWHGETSLPEYVAAHVPAGCRLEIVSPFFDDLAETPTLKALIDAVQPTATRVLLPRDDHGRAQCRREFFEAARALPGVKWGQLPGAFTTFGKSHADAKQRYVHAKIYRFFSPANGTEMMLVGSPNLTDAAHRGARRGNFETAVLLDLESKARLDWWLEPIDEDPSEFRPPVRSEDEALAAVLPVTLRFDWGSGSLTYYWEQRRASVEGFTVTAAGRPIAQTLGVIFDAWTAIQADPEVLRDVLRANSFLDVTAGDGPAQRVLVQETGMENKPSILRELSPEQILEYWSMLTTEQQDAFLEDKILRMASADGDANPGESVIDPTSMFDRFAGIFHAFSCLRGRIDEALRRGDASGERHAIYRLFGKRHDSLGSLVDKLIANDEGDLVNRYVSLLCADEVVRWVRREHRSFAAEHKGELADLATRVRRTDELRSGFSFGTEDERNRFFGWLEEMFFIPIKLPEARA
jgi:hypothetical protein